MEDIGKRESVRRRLLERWGNVSAALARDGSVLLTDPSDVHLLDGTVAFLAPPSSPSRERVEVTDGVEAELAKLLAAATPGPWVISRPEQKGEDWPNGIIVAATARGMGIFASGDTGAFPSADRQLIAAMRNHLPGILATLAAQRERVEVLEEVMMATEELLGAARNFSGYRFGDGLSDRTIGDVCRRLGAALAALGEK